MEKETQVSTNRIGLYPGTFDPPTSGHLDIIKRALHVVDKLVMGVAINAGKSPMFSLFLSTDLCGIYIIFALETIPRGY